MPLPVEPRHFGSDAAAIDEPPSQALLPVAIPTVLLFCAQGTELDEVCHAIIKAGIRPAAIPKRTLLPPSENAPQFCFVELALPGAREYLESLTEKGNQPQFIAAVTEEARSGEAYALGATTTLTRPLDPALVVAILESWQKRVLRQRQSDVIVEHDRRISTANAFEGLLRAVGQDVRNPLAAALANMEFLSDYETTQQSPITEAEHHAIVKDTLTSLQQIRRVLEQVSALVPKDPPELRMLRLWSIAQRVLDDLPAGHPSLEIVGDHEVRGWGDEATLVEVTTSLVRLVLERAHGDKSANVKIHVYAHDTEARLTVHDQSPLSTEPLRDPFHPGLTLLKSGQSGLLLTAARHAIVRMGGALNYVPRTKSGYAFRVRLRLAQEHET